MTPPPQVSRARLFLDYLARGQSHRYGPHRSQRADLYFPGGGGGGGQDSVSSHPLMVTIHGGSWKSRYGKFIMRALVGDLTRRGWAVWNIEYRRVGGGGGWPATFEDVALAIDHLAALDDPRLDLDRVSVLGHSAGGHLALWAAGRENLPAGAPGALAGPPPVRLRRVISQAGVVDLVGGYGDRTVIGQHGGAVWGLMGGAPEELPERYAVGDPMRLLPVPMPVLLVHGVIDDTVSVQLSRGYAHAARDAGCEVELVEIEGEAGGHRTHVDPRGEAWAAVTARLPAADPIGSPSRSALAR
jgi:acetyl esterase/lipase